MTVRNPSDAPPRMDRFRAELRADRKGGVEHPWQGLRAVARSLFGDAAFEPARGGEEPQLNLKRWQMEKLAGHPDTIATELHKLFPKGLPGGEPIGAAAKRFSGAAKVGLDRSGLSATTSSHGRLRLMTFNIKHGSLSSLREIAAFIKKQHPPPDMIALEEVDRGQSRSGKVNQAAVLGKMLGMHSTFQPACKMNDGEYGVALLSRFPIKSSDRTPLGRFGNNEPRVLLEAKVDVDGRQIPVNVTHLTHLGGAERQMQMHKVMKEVSKDSILMGDFNAQPGSPTYNMANRRFHDTWAEGSGAPGHRIDYIFTGTGFVTLDAEIPNGARGLSDHLPRTAVVKLK